MARINGVSDSYDVNSTGKIDNQNAGMKFLKSINQLSFWSYAKEFFMSGLELVAKSFGFRTASLYPNIKRSNAQIMPADMQAVWYSAKKDIRLGISQLPFLKQRGVATAVASHIKVGESMIKRIYSNQDKISLAHNKKWKDACLTYIFTLRNHVSNLLKDEGNETKSYLLTPQDLKEELRFILDRIVTPSPEEPEFFYKR